MENFVFPEELMYFIESLRPFQLTEIGTAKWFDVHEMVIKLSQQAILEATEYREEVVKEELITHDKLKILIHEAYCVFVWKTRVLPHLLEIDPNPPATFLLYTVLFHEGVVISLLDTALFHSKGCEILHGTAIDLIDYCAQGVAQVIGLVCMGYNENATIDIDEGVLAELERQKRDLIYKIGLRCISILSYLADNASSLSLSATTRMVKVHDIPWLMADLLHYRPWQRQTNKGLEKFINDKWVVVESKNAGDIMKTEAQAWFCLRQILFNKSMMELYKMSEERRIHLSKCQCLLNETVLDQLPPLIELKQYLCQLGIGGGTDNKDKHSSLLLEEVAEIQDAIIKQAEDDGGFLAIAQTQQKLFLSDDKSVLLEMAQRLNAAYNTDLLIEIEKKAADIEEQSKTSTEKKINKCGKCSAEANRKCSQCKTMFYCSRECQKDDWPEHKLNCIKLQQPQN